MPLSLRLDLHQLLLLQMIDLLMHELLLVLLLLHLVLKGLFFLIWFECGQLLVNACLLLPFLDQLPLEIRLI